MDIKPGDAVEGYVLAEDNRWYPQPPPWPDPRPGGGSQASEPQDALTRPSRQLTHAGPALDRPTPVRPLYALWWFRAGIGAIVVLAGVVLAATYQQADRYQTPTSWPAIGIPTEPGTAQPWRTPEPVSAGGLGDRVRDGEVEFTVTGVDCSRSELGQYAKATAKGQFCVVSVQATNLGTERVSLPAHQMGFGSAGQWVAADYVAQMYLGGPSLYSSPVEPSTTVSGPLVFDVLDHATLTAVSLRAHPESTGAVVKLS